MIAIIFSKILLLLWGIASGMSSTLIPWFIPIAIGFSHWLLTVWFHRLFVVVLMCVSSTAGTSVLRYLDGHINRLLKKFLPKDIPGKERYEKWIIKRFRRRSEQYLHIINNRFVLLVMVAFFARSVVPDIVIVRIVRHKQSYAEFALATLIGKWFVYFPIVLGLRVLAKVL